MVRLSSRLTIVVKFINPIIGVIGSALIYYTLTTQFNNPPPNFILLPFIALIPAVACWPHFMVQAVYFNNRYLFSNNFLSNKKIDIKSILKIYSYARYFYVIKYYDRNKEGKIYFFPRTAETFMNFSGEPKSVVEIKKLLNNR